MTHEVYLTHTFKKCLKILKKKYRNIKNDIIGVIRELETDCTVGDPVPGWNREIWKVRVASSDIKKGKRGGFRLIYFFRENDSRIYLLTIYFKGDQNDVAPNEIDRLLKNLSDELEAF